MLFLLYMITISTILPHMQAFKLQENTTEIIARTSINVTDINKTENASNMSLIKITQPSTNFETFTKVTENKSTKNMTASKPEFIPSPQLETYIEEERYPVVTAYPGIKHIFSENYAQNKEGHTSHKNKKHKYEYLNTIYGTPKYATITNITDKPLQSAQDKQLFHKGYENPIRDFPSLKYYERFNLPHSTEPSFEWFRVYPTKPTSLSLAEHPYPFITDFTKKSVAPTMQIPKTMEYSAMSSPWKKAAKIFAAILPIGLLISALTPNILTITPLNETYKQQCRKLANRAENAGLDKVLIENLSIPGCEVRLLCETAIKDENLDADAIKNLFWSFVSQNAEDSKTSEYLEAVTNAIKEKTCDKIPCSRTKDGV